MGGRRLDPKRSFDLALSLAGLVLLVPLLAAIVVLIRLGSAGPALFRQVRVGRQGKNFTLLKFRSMSVRSGSEQGDFDAGDSSRVTCLGRLLRASKLDELPQLWNVVRGEMSLVGPRPEVRKWVDAYPERWAIVHTVRPGITDPASIVYRHEERILAEALDPESVYRDTILPHKLTLYEGYVRSRSFLGDLAILGRTALALVRKSHLPDPPEPRDERRH